MTLDIGKFHNASYDAYATVQLFWVLMEEAENINLDNFNNKISGITALEKVCMTKGKQFSLYYLRNEEVDKWNHFKRNQEPIVRQADYKSIKDLESKVLEDIFQQYGFSSEMNKKQ